MMCGLAVVLFLVWAHTVYGWQKEQRRVLRSPREKLQLALSYYENGKYWRAIPLLEEMVEAHTPYPFMDSVLFYYGMCLARTGEMWKAISHWRFLVQAYPNSPLTEEAHFRMGYAYYLLSPPYEFDQSLTDKAINQLQLFITLYPESQWRSKSEELLRELQRKLELKAYYNAGLYYRLGRWQAALNALQTLLEDHPFLPERTQVQIMILRSAYNYALNSVEEKQRERFAIVAELYDKFVVQNPALKTSKEAQEIVEKARQKLKSP